MIPVDNYNAIFQPLANEDRLAPSQWNALQQNRQNTWNQLAAADWATRRNAQLQGVNGLTDNRLENSILGTIPQASDFTRTVGRLAERELGGSTADPYEVFAQQARRQNPDLFEPQINAAYELWHGRSHQEDIQDLYNQEQQQRASEIAKMRAAEFASKQMSEQIQGIGSGYGAHPLELLQGYNPQTGISEVGGGMSKDPITGEYSVPVPKRQIRLNPAHYERLRQLAAMTYGSAPDAQTPQSSLEAQIAAAEARKASETGSSNRFPNWMRYRGPAEQVAPSGARNAGEQIRRFVTDIPNWPANLDRAVLDVGTAHQNWVDRNIGTPLNDFWSGLTGAK